MFHEKKQGRVCLFVFVLFLMFDEEKKQDSFQGFEVNTIRCDNYISISFGAQVRHPLNPLNTIVL